jgi:nickel transport protein
MRVHSAIPKGLQHLSWSSTMKRLVWTLGFVMALVGGVYTPAFAHEVLHTVDRHHAIAVKAYFVDGEVLAYVPYDLYSPADPKIPYQKGRTDRGGYVAFVPDTPGKWRIKITDDTGHGLNVEIDATPGTDHNAKRSDVGQIASSAVFILRPLVGIAVIILIFGILLFVYRRKEK